MFPTSQMPSQCQFPGSETQNLFLIIDKVCFHVIILLTLLFNLYFDRVINYLQLHIPASKAIQIANLLVRAALTTDVVILLAH